MTPQEIKIAQHIFTILPTLTIAICLAIVYVRLQLSAKAKNDKELIQENRISMNETNIVQLVKIHLDRHPGDASKFMKKEFISTK